MKTLRRAALAALIATASPTLGQEAKPASPEPPATPSSPAPAAPAAAPSPAKAGPRGPTVTGWVNVQYTSTDAPAPAKDSDTFELRRARLGVRGELSPNLGYAVVYDAADNGTKDAYGALKALTFAPGVELRAGQGKIPFGYENAESDHKLLWVNTSYAVAALARASTVATPTATPDSRDVGVTGLGRWALGGGLGLRLAAAVTNGAGPNRRDDLRAKNLWGRAGVGLRTAAASLELGASYGHGKALVGLGANGRFDGVGVSTDDLNLDFTTFGGDATIDGRWLFVAAEYIRSDRELLDRATRTTAPADARGWYVGAYAKTPWNAGPLARFERFDRNRDVEGQENERLTLGLYADLVSVNGRLIVNWEDDRSDAAVRTGDRLIVSTQVVF